MTFEERPNKRNSMNNVRGIMGMTMGVIYVALAVAVIYFQRSGQILQDQQTLSYLIAGLMVGYGIFRVYRGYKIFKGDGY